MSDEFIVGRAVVPIHPPSAGGSRKIHCSRGCAVYYANHPEFAVGDSGVSRLAIGETATITQEVYLKASPNEGDPANEAAVLVEP